MFFDVSHIFIIIPVLLFSLGVHEAMHAFAAHALGDTTAQDMGRLTLNPLAHIDLMTTVLLPIVLILIGGPPLLAAKPVPFNPNRVKYEEFGAALVGLAGPFTNLGMAIIGALILRLTTITSGMLLDVLLIFVGLNVAFFVFNMIPFPPLDGSRLLYAVAPEPLQRVMLQIESMGFTAILLFFFLLVPFLGPLIVYANNAILRVLLGSIYSL
jgi:Zn-dependent protease